MTMTSYAQNFEDVILSRALRHVAKGFYVDAGAQHPVVDSVSLAFYERGWRGIHIEPIPDYASALQAARPDEIVLAAALGSTEGSIELYDVQGTGMSTSDPAFAELHAARGYQSRPIQVPMLPLWKVLESVQDGQVHWLKIDVEGMEKQVIEGLQPSSIRPWIVVVESTLPNSPEPNHHGWEPLLISFGYQFVYFDGLNRFYVSNDHPELVASFGPGPNVFDDFVIAEVINLRLEARALHERVAVLAASEAELDAILQSASWRMTRPLRTLVHMTRRART